MNIDRFKSVLWQMELREWRSDDGINYSFEECAQILAGRQRDPTTAREDARRFLRLTYAEADYIFRRIY